MWMELKSFIFIDTRLECIEENRWDKQLDEAFKIVILIRLGFIWMKQLVASFFLTFSSKVHVLTLYYSVLDI